MLGANEQAVFCTLRTRLCCEVFHNNRRVTVQRAFNEACIDRGLGRNFLQLDCYIDGSYVTTIQVRSRSSGAQLPGLALQLWKHPNLLCAGNALGSCYSASTVGSPMLPVEQ